MRIRSRKLLPLLLVLLVLAPAAAQVRTVTLLHISDLHAHLLPDAEGRGGFAQLATAIRREREHCQGCLLLNAGDLVQGTPVSTMFHGLPLIQISNDFGIDASTLGNHEFDYGLAQVRRFLRVSRYPVVTANFVDGGGRLLTRTPYVVLHANGVRVGVLGLTMGNLASTVDPRLLGPYHSLPAMETVRKYLPELQKSADIIVVLGHLDEREALAVLHEVPGVSVVVYGHTHKELLAEGREGARVMVEVAPYGRELGRLELQVDVGRHQVTASSWKRVAITAAAFPAAPDVAAEVATWEKQVSRVVDVRIGESRRDFTQEEVKAMMERALVEETGADLGYMNLFGIRDVLHRGPILARAVWDIMPFDNQVAVVTFKGSELPPVLAQGRSIDPGRTYRVATSDFIVYNPAESAKLGSQGKPFRVRRRLLRDVLIDWIRKQRVLP